MPDLGLHREVADRCSLTDSGSEITMSPSPQREMRCRGGDDAIPEEPTATCYRYLFFGLSWTAAAQLSLAMSHSSTAKG